MHQNIKKVFLSISAICLLAFTGLAQKVSPETALKSYMANGDKSYQWELKDSVSLGTSKAYHVLLTSQKWQNITWKHQLTIIIPAKVNYEGAMLFITGGSNKDEQPNWSKDDKMWTFLSMVAAKNHAIVALIKQVPNQPLYGGKTEDELISYTLHQFRETGDHSWPLLFPMVKSAVRGMDAIQEFASKKANIQIKDFVISGASKRGWTTWLSSAIGDSRVKAIGPMVIDMLNMPATLNYQKDTYGEYSDQIEDYVKLGIPQGTGTPVGKAINAMIDPYSYRANMTIPKIIFMGTNDPYWTADAIKHYFDQIPGKNLIHYVPNAGHDLAGGKQAIEALSAFFGLTLQNKDYPVPTWNVVKGKEGFELTVTANPTDLEDAAIWGTTSADRDFRNNLWLTRRVKPVGNTAKYVIPYVKKGYQAFYMDLKYKDPNGGSYTISTRIFTTDTDKVL
ncbi:PhoPQ-activated pathogenicity-like protein PqaA type [Cytophagaceae bacterium 50C-KIRBA]|uniref:PhoPQ-activated pathogenicity-like protein PqaA type n=1 Tax=Aquirufa beregesia TaxID=2516556 RepID=A0ABX0EYU3_9BACT|nr:PhoPQ-activated protein PqaA family protein [Aquirufa beregesia]NGZ44613.1 PhoPQ-activated pathogenicity-like protein PqaA type [Aquirufa beregesia]